MMLMRMMMMPMLLWMLLLPLLLLLLLLLAFQHLAWGLLHQQEVGHFCADDLVFEPGHGEARETWLQNALLHITCVSHPAKFGWDLVQLGPCHMRWTDA